VGWPHRWRWREESIQRMVSIAEERTKLLQERNVVKMPEKNAETAQKDL
jgi:hypothetical protein